MVVFSQSERWIWAGLDKAARRRLLTGSPGKPDFGLLGLEIRRATSRHPERAANAGSEGGKSGADGFGERHSKPYRR